MYQMFIVHPALVMQFYHVYVRYSQIRYTSMLLVSICYVSNVHCTSCIGHAVLSCLCEVFTNYVHKYVAGVNMLCIN